MPVSFKVKMSRSQIRSAIRGATRAVSHFDILYRDKFEPRLKNEIQNIFNTEGYGTWLPTRNRRNPILIDTGRLLRSYTRSGAPGNVEIL